MLRCRVGGVEQLAEVNVSGLANFVIPENQGPQAYAGQMMIDHPDLDAITVLADAVVAIRSFYSRLVLE